MNLITAEKCKAMKSGFKQLAKPNGPMGFYTNPNGDVHKEEADLQRELQLSGFLALTQIYSSPTNIGSDPARKGDNSNTFLFFSDKQLLVVWADLGLSENGVYHGISVYP